MTAKKFVPRPISAAMAAEGYNNEGRGKLIGYIADPSKHEKDCPYRRDESCSCRIGLWQESGKRPKKIATFDNTTRVSRASAAIIMRTGNEKAGVLVSLRDEHNKAHHFELSTEISEELARQLGAMGKRSS